MTYDPLNYRDANPTDLDAICELGQVVNRAHHEHYPRIFAADTSLRHQREQWSDYLDSPNSKTIVAEGDSNVIAFVNAELEETKNVLLKPMKLCRIGSVCVAESHRRRGIGRELMQRVENWAVEMGAEDLRLHVWMFNEGAIQMYERLGFSRRSLNMGKSLGMG